VPDPAVAVGGVGAERTVGGVSAGEKETHDITKNTVVEAMWGKTRPTMHALWISRMGGRDLPSEFHPLCCH
jgi:hypothetical protein